MCSADDDGQFASGNDSCIAFRDSFGISISEVQACGGLVATPYSEWVPSYWIKEAFQQRGPGQLGGNSLDYDNDVEKLNEMLKQGKQEWTAEAARATFLAEYPEYYNGDTNALRKAIEGVLKDGILSRLIENRS